MAVFAEAGTTFGRVKQRLDGTAARLKETRGFLEDLIDALQIGARLKPSLRKIGRAADGLRRLLNAIRSPPAGPWGVAFKALKEALELILRAIDEAMSAASTALTKVDEAMAGLRKQLRATAEALEALEVRVEQARGLLDRLIAQAAFLERQQDEVEELMGPEWVAALRRALARLDALCAPLDNLNRQLDTLKGKMEPLAKRIRELLDQLDALADKLEGLAAEIERVERLASGVWRRILALLNNLPPAVRRALRWVGDTLDGVADYLKRLFQPTLDKIERLLDEAGVLDAINGLKKKIAAAFDPLRELAKELLDELAALTRAVDALRRALDSVDAKLKALAEELGGLELLFGVISLMKLLREWYLIRLSDEHLERVRALGEGELVEHLESGRLKEVAATLAEGCAELEFVVQGLALRGEVDGFIRELPARELAAAIGDWSIEVGRRSAALSRAAAAWRPGAAELEAEVRAELGALTLLYARAAELTQRPDPERFPEEYFVAAASSVGLAVGELAAAPPRAAKKWIFTVYRGMDPAADDLHVTLRGTGGSLRNPQVVLQPDGCPPARASIPERNPNQVKVVWDRPCIGAGDTVAIQVESDFVPLEVERVVWTLRGRELPS